MKRRNIQLAFTGDGITDSTDSDTVAEYQVKGDDAVEIDVSGGKLLLVVPAGTPDDGIFEAATSLGGELVLETGQRLSFEMKSEAIGAQFAVSEADALLASLAENAQPRRWIWRCDALPLREQMEATYLAAYAQAARDLDRVEQFLYPQLRMIVSSLLPSYHGGLLEVPAWPEGLTPSVAPLSDKVTIDLGVSWWRRWFASRRLAKERANHLRCLIEEDFSKIAEDLVQEAQTHLAERVDYIMRRVNAISNGLRTGVERRTANLARERALIDRAGDEQDQKRFETEQQRRAEGCAARQEAYAAVLGELEAVLGGLDSAQDESRPE